MAEPSGRGHEIADALWRDAEDERPDYRSVLHALATARDEGRREQGPITDAMVANAAVALRPWFPTKTPINQLAAARAALEAAESVRR